jgi:hypothetical protein
MDDDFGVDSKLCRQFQDHSLIDFGRIEMSLRVNAARHEYQRDGKDCGVRGFHNQIFSNMVPANSGTWSGLSLLRLLGLHEVKVHKSPEAPSVIDVLGSWQFDEKRPSR